MSERDSIYIEWGRFKAGATGKFAIVVVIVAVAATKFVGWW